MTVSILSLRKRHGERLLALFTWQLLAAELHVCVDCLISTACQSAQVYVYMYFRLVTAESQNVERGQGKGGGGHRTAGSKRRMCDIPIGGILGQGLRK